MAHCPAAVMAWEVLPPGTANPVTLATSPPLGQAPAPPSKEKNQPQKHATSVITGTFFLAPAAAQPTGDGSGTGAPFIATRRVLAVLIQQRRHRLLLSLRRPPWPTTPHAV
jgi:hypothetical protein